MTILEQISSDTIVFLQTHKRIWPASQRDALFWSHMKNIREKGDPNANDEWLVCNHSIELDTYPANVGKCVRIFLTVIMFCQTYVHPSVVAAKGNQITRDDLTCKITYCSTGMYIAQSLMRQSRILISILFDCSESRRLGTCIRTPSGLQKRVSKVPQTIHRLRCWPM